MPWLQTEPMHQRLLFVEEAGRKRMSMSDLCRLFGISRRIGYKWLRRAKEGDEISLADASRRPHSHPMATADEVVERLIELRKKHPTWGARKLLAWLDQHEPWWLLPVASTVTDILKRHGLVEPRQRVRRGTPCRSPLADATKPNVVWAMDFKGDFRVGDGTRCYPLTVLDGYSRMALCCRSMLNQDRIPVERALERTFRAWGLPDRMRSDNGTPFGTKCRGPLSRLSVWLLKVGVRPEYIEPASPQENGRLERFHGTLKKETAFPPASSIPAQQRRFNRFLREYNEERPHEACGQLPPVMMHTVSSRPFPSQLEEPAYPGHYEVIRLHDPGYFNWGGVRHYVGEPLSHELVGMVEVDNGIREVYFGPLLVGVLDERVQPPRLLPMFPV